MSYYRCTSDNVYKHFVIGQLYKVEEYYYEGILYGIFTMNNEYLGAIEYSEFRACFGDSSDARYVSIDIILEPQ